MSFIEEVGIPILQAADDLPEVKGLFSKQSLVFLMISFRLSIAFALVSRFAKFIPLRKGWGGSDDERLIIKRIIGVLVLILLLLGVLRIVFGDHKAATMYFEYLAFDLTVAKHTLFALGINSLLFIGNLYYYYTYSSLIGKLQVEYEESRLKWFKTYLIAPILEESVYCGMLFASYSQLGLVGNLNFSLSSSVCFGLSHTHMKWEEIKEIFKIPGLSILQKLKQCFFCCIGVVVQTTIFSLYAKVVFLKYRNVWPCIFLHGYCNMLGGPKTGFDKAKTLHTVGVVTGVALLWVC